MGFIGSGWLSFGAEAFGDFKSKSGNLDTGNNAGVGGSAGSFSGFNVSYDCLSFSNDDLE